MIDTTHDPPLEWLNSTYQFLISLFFRKILQNLNIVEKRKISIRKYKDLNLSGCVLERIYSNMFFMRGSEIWIPLGSIRFVFLLHPLDQRHILRQATRYDCLSSLLGDGST